MRLTPVTDSKRRNVCGPRRPNDPALHLVAGQVQDGSTDSLVCSVAIPRIASRDNLGGQRLLRRPGVPSFLSVRYQQCGGALARVLAWF